MVLHEFLKTKSIYLLIRVQGGVERLPSLQSLVVGQRSRFVNRRIEFALTYLAVILLGHFDDEFLLGVPSCSCDIQVVGNVSRDGLTAFISFPLATHFGSFDSE